VTGNVRHFARIPELRIENWLVEDGRLQASTK
jgi:predicted nucleic acid-binding protein